MTKYWMVVFGTAQASLATVGFTLINADGTTHTARSTTGVTERPAASGTYGASIDIPADFQGEIRWDTGGASPVYASEPINPEQNAIFSSVSDSAPTTSSFVGASGLSSTNNFYAGAILVFLEGTLKGVSRKVASYVGSSRTFYFNQAFPAAPANGNEFQIIGRVEST